MFENDTYDPETGEFKVFKGEGLLKRSLNTGWDVTSGQLTWGQERRNFEIGVEQLDMGEGRVLT